MWTWCFSQPPYFSLTPMRLTILQRILRSCQSSTVGVQSMRSASLTWKVEQGYHGVSSFLGVSGVSGVSWGIRGMDKEWHILDVEAHLLGCICPVIFLPHGDKSLGFWWSPTASHLRVQTRNKTRDFNTIQVHHIILPTKLLVAADHNQNVQWLFMFGMFAAVIPLGFLPPDALLRRCLLILRSFG